MTRALAFLILLALLPAFWVSVTVTERIDDLDPAATSTDRLPYDFAAFVAGLHDRKPPTAMSQFSGGGAATREDAAAVPTVTSPVVEPSSFTSTGSSPDWYRLADCESGEWDRNRNPIPGTARWNDNRNGYEGGVHFAPSTWDGFRDADMPEAAYLASPEVQIVVAERVLAAQGPGAWPVCSYKAGLR